MSHLSTIKTQIKDLDALRAAVVELGHTLEVNAFSREFWGQSAERKAMVIKLAGCPYDVSVQKEMDDTYSLVTDKWNGQVEAKLGKDFQTLMHMYATHKTIALARARGYSATREVQPGGITRLRIQGRGL